MSIRPDELQQWVSMELGVGDWLKIDQQRIDRFADVTEDHQFIHVDQEKAAQTPFGGTIAHGFLTLSLLTRLCATAVPEIDDVKFALNYGFEKLRFLAPARSGSEVRARVVLKDVEEKPGMGLRLTYGVTVEIRGEEKPALVADWLTMILL